MDVREGVCVCLGRDRLEKCQAGDGAGTMEEIQKIVFEIADRCSRRRIPVNDMLAAFVAKFAKVAILTAVALGGGFLKFFKRKTP